MNWFQAVAVSRCTGVIVKIQYSLPKDAIIGIVDLQGLECQGREFLRLCVYDIHVPGVGGSFCSLLHKLEAFKPFCFSRLVLNQP